MSKLKFWPQSQFLILINAGSGQARPSNSEHRALGYNHDDDDPKLMAFRRLPPDSESIFCINMFQNMFTQSMFMYSGHVRVLRTYSCSQNLLVYQDHPRILRTCSCTDIMLVWPDSVLVARILRTCWHVVLGICPCTQNMFVTRPKNNDATRPTNRKAKTTMGETRRDEDGADATTRRRR